MNHGHAADSILIARRIHTMGPRISRGTNAVAICCGMVGAIGSARALIKSMRGRRTHVVDLGDGAITPGLVDSHTHFFYWAINRRLVIDVTGLPTLAATVDRLRKEAPRKRVGDWIVARGFDYNLWEGGSPTAADLDAAFPRDAVMVRSRDGHTAWLNSRGLALAGITANRVDPPGGRYLRDGHGAPTGIVQEAAIGELPDPVRDFAARADEAAWKLIDAALQDVYEIAWGFGFTGVHSMDDGPSWYHFQRQHGEDKLGLRIVHAVRLADFERATELGLRAGLGDDQLRLGAVKIFADGALGSQTAYMFDAYPGRGDYRGVPNVAGDRLRAAVCRCSERGWPVWIHAIGDRAASDAIDAIAAARRTEKVALPHRIEHAQCVRPVDVRRMAKLGIFASVQPCHLPGDIENAGKYWPRAQRHAYPLRGMIDAGVTLAAGSDLPIESIDPRRSFHAAVARTNELGRPAGGWIREQRISAREVLRAFTRGAAESVGEPAPCGTIQVGGPADLALWEDDPIEASAVELPELRISGCVMNGRLHLGTA